MTSASKPAPTGRKWTIDSDRFNDRTNGHGLFTFIYVLIVWGCFVSLFIYFLFCFSWLWHGPWPKLPLIIKDSSLIGSSSNRDVETIVLTTYMAKQHWISSTRDLLRHFDKDSRVWAEQESIWCQDKTVTRERGWWQSVSMVGCTRTPELYFLRWNVAERLRFDRGEKKERERELCDSFL